MRVSGLVADWVFEAHERSEGDDFTAYRDKCSGILEVFEPHVRNLEALIAERAANIQAIPAEEVEGAFEEPEVPLKEEAAPPPPKQPKKAAPQTGSSMKPDAQKILDDLLQQVSGKPAAKASYPSAKVREDLPETLRNQLVALKANGIKTIAPDILEQMSADFGVSKLRIAEYFGWLNR